jgi:LemA protein
MSDVALTGLIFAGLLAAGYAMSAYNSLVLAKNRVKRAWLDLDAVLCRRHDEVERLTSAFGAGARFWKESMERAVELRLSARQSRTVAARAILENELTTALKKAVALGEGDPEVASQSSFVSVRMRVNSLESQVAHRRDAYNTSVNDYNLRLQILPEKLLASYWGLAPQVLFRTDDPALSCYRNVT